MSLSNGDILRIAVSLLMPDSVIAQNIFYAVLTAGTDPYDEADIISDVKDYIEDIYESWDSIGDSGVSLDNIQVYVYDSVDDDWDEVGSDTSSVAGLVSGDMLPHGVAAYTQARTTDPDVSASKYWPGLTETSQSEGNWVSATMTQLAALAAIWVAGDTGAASGATLEAGVWSTKNTNFFAFNGNVVVNGFPAYQRRRKPGVGT